MSHPQQIERRSLPPIQIPRVEAVVWLPRACVEAVNRFGIDVEQTIVALACEGLVPPFQPSPRFVEAWPEYWKGFDAIRPGMMNSRALVKVAIPMKATVLDCVEVLAQQVGVHPGNVILAILARQLPLYGAKLDLPPSIEPEVPQAGKILPGPWGKSEG